VDGKGYLTLFLLVPIAICASSGTVYAVSDETFLITTANATWNYFNAFSDNGLPYSSYNVTTGINATYFNPAEVGFYALSPILAYEMGIDCDWDCAINKTSLTLSSIDGLLTYKQYDRVIWSLGDNEAPMANNTVANDEFDQVKANFHFYNETMNVGDFPKDINDGSFPQIFIYFNLTSEDLSENLSLYLDTVDASHGSVPYFNLRIKAGPSNGSLVEIGEFKFGANGSHPAERYIEINSSYLAPGNNTILLENASSPGSGSWLLWDSLGFGVPSSSRTYYQNYETGGIIYENNKQVPSIDNAWLAVSLIAIREYAEANGATALEAQANGILDNLNFSIWYNYTSHMFTWGALNDPHGGGDCDIYSNENRIINFVARALGHLNATEFQASLDALNQSSATYNSITVGKGNWDGSYFTYASPALFAREMETAYGENTLEKAARAQIRYAQDQSYAFWGISDAISPNNESYYMNLGAPPSLGSYNDEKVITPHASAMALINRNQTIVDSAISNLKGLKGNYSDIYNDDYGFRDTVNLTDSVVCPKILTLDQQWIFLSLANNLNRTIWKYLYRDQGVRDAHCEMYNCSELSVLDMEFSPSNPLKDETVTVNITMQNTGNADANDTVVKLYVDGTYQNESTINVSAGGNAEMQFSWEALYGTHNISAEIDPDDLIVESGETNNTANESILVVKGNRTEVNASANQTTTVAAMGIGVSIDFVVAMELNGTINITLSNETPAIPLNSTFGLLSSEVDIGEYITVNASENIEGNLTWAVLEFYYNTSDLDSGGTAIDPGTLKFYWNNETYWNRLDYASGQYNNYTSEGGPFVHESGVNQTANNGFLGCAWANVTHFSVYGVGGSPVQVSYPPSNGPSVVVKKIHLLSNSIDLGLATGFLEYFDEKGVKVYHLNASNFTGYNKNKNIVILGGHEAYDGIGDIVKEVLNETEQHEVSRNNYGTYFMKEKVWTNTAKQRVFVIAGKNRNVTEKACANNMERIRSKLLS
jgi:hypothetical protein